MRQNNSGWGIGNEGQTDVPGRVRLEVHDMLGRRLATLINEHKTAGSHAVNDHLERSVAGINACIRILPCKQIEYLFRATD